MLPSSCHNSLVSPACRCPEYEPDPDHSEAACDLCCHALEWHYPPLEVGWEEGKERKARGEEVLELCKDRLGDGRECPCPVFVRGAGVECALCGHKKGWHKWKDSQVPTSPRSPLSSPSSVGSYGSYSTTYFPAPLAIPQSSPTSPRPLPSPRLPPTSPLEPTRITRSPSSALRLTTSPRIPIARTVSVVSVGGPAAPEDPEFYRPEPLQRRTSLGAGRRESLEFEAVERREEERVVRERDGRERQERERREEEDREELQEAVEAPARGAAEEGRERHGSIASSASGGTVNFGRGAGDELARVPSVGGAQPRWKEYEGKSKNLTLSVSPPLDTGQRFSPGQVFLFRLTLGSKVTLASYEKIEVRLVGNSYVYGEPPDDHDFLSLRTTIAPLSESDHTLETGFGLRSFSWTTTLPLDQNCRCSPEAIPLPPSYTHANFCVRYRVELVSKKQGTFSKLGGPERGKIQFPVDAPFVEQPGVVRSPTSVVPAISGVDGPWLTSRLPGLIRLDGQETGITSTELAWQVLPSPTLIRIPYRISFTFGPLPPTQNLHITLLESLANACRISLSRRIVLSESGGAKEVPLNALRVAVREGREAERVVEGVEGRVWRWEGVLEVVRGEARSLSTCNVSVRYMISVHSVPVAGVSNEVRLVARNLVLERLTTPARNPHSFPDSPSTPVDRISPTTTRPPSDLIPRRGVQLQDGRRPPSISGSSFFRQSLDSPNSSRGSGSYEDPPPGFDSEEEEEEEELPPFEEAVGRVE